MKTGEDLEAYLRRLERTFERTDETTLLVAVAPRQPPVALVLAPPLLVVQAVVGMVPDGLGIPQQAKLFRRMLELNATDLVHAAYGLEGQNIQLAAALEFDTLDLNELEAVLADMGLALSNHIPELRELVGNQ